MSITRTPTRVHASLGALSVVSLVVFTSAGGLRVVPLLATAGEVVGADVNWLTLAISQLLLEYLADHDSLAGLVNRRAVDRHLNTLVTGIGAGNAPGVVVLFVDLNGFKTINDDHGHVGGQAAHPSRSQSAHPRQP